jgi:outer membrane protein assembly factor BamD
MKLIRSGLLLFTCTSLMLLQGCATTTVADAPPGELYKQGETAFQKSRYERAVEYWKKVKEAFPDPELASRAEIGIANAYFLNQDFIEAGAAYEDFRKLHPTHELAQFALYRQGLASFNLITGIDTDQTPVKNALTLFESFIRQYPNSQYVAKVQEKIVECRGKLAQYEIYVGRFYYRTNYYIAAIGRFEWALANFPDYAGHDQTLFYLGKSALEVRDTDKMQSAFTRLIREYPKSSYLGDARKLLAQNS